MMNQIIQTEIKELTSTLYSLKGLSEELSQEKETIMSSAGQISYASKQFKKYSDRFEEQIEEVNRNIPSIIAQEIKSNGKLIAEEASRSFVDSSTKQTQEAIRKLLDTTERCQERMEEASKRFSYLSRWFITAILGATLIGGLAGGGILYYLTPRLDETILAQIRSGEAIQVIWSKLDKKEKEKLSALYTGNSHKGR